MDNTTNTTQNNNEGANGKQPQRSESAATDKSSGAPSHRQGSFHHPGLERVTSEDSVKSWRTTSSLAEEMRQFGGTEGEIDWGTPRHNANMPRNARLFGSLSHDLAAQRRSSSGLESPTTAPGEGRQWLPQGSDQAGQSTESAAPHSGMRDSPEPIDASEQSGHKGHKGEEEKR